jgi:hypothetical protein
MAVLDDGASAMRARPGRVKADGRPAAGALALLWKNFYVKPYGST